MHWPRTMTMDFAYRTHFHNPSLDAYGRVLLDAMLFWRQDGIEASWDFLTPVLRECEPTASSCPPVYPYAAGSWGPEITADLVNSLCKARENS